MKQFSVARHKAHKKTHEALFILREFFISIVYNMSIVKMWLYEIFVGIIPQDF